MKPFLFIIAMFISSCSLISNNDELIQKDTWILNRVDSFQNGQLKTSYFKPSKKELCLTFKKDGSFVVSENKGDKFGTAHWEWIKDKEHISIETSGGGKREYYILKLDGQELTWTKQNLFSDTLIHETFIHSDNEEWTDEKVENYNKLLLNK